jgi:hypothetical protein
VSRSLIPVLNDEVPDVFFDHWIILCYVLVGKLTILVQTCSSSALRWLVYYRYVSDRYL